MPNQNKPAISATSRPLTQQLALHAPVESNYGVHGCSHRLYQLRLKLPSNLSVFPDLIFLSALCYCRTADSFVSGTAHII
jgi:hypothetical protein